MAAHSRTGKSRKEEASQRRKRKKRRRAQRVRDVGAQEQFGEEPEDRERREAEEHILSPADLFDKVYDDSFDQSTGDWIVRSPAAERKTIVPGS